MKPQQNYSRQGPRPLEDVGFLISVEGPWFLGAVVIGQIEDRADCPWNLSSVETSAFLATVVAEAVVAAVEGLMVEVEGP